MCIRDSSNSHSLTESTNESLTEPAVSQSGESTPSHSLTECKTLALSHTPWHRLTVTPFPMPPLPHALAHSRGRRRLRA
eukprot:2491809-Rhodomonas_salina.1